MESIYDRAAKSLLALMSTESPAIEGKIDIEALSTAVNALRPGLRGKWLNEFTEREQKQIHWAYLYTNGNWNQGTDGHNNLRIIAQMANQLETNEYRAKTLPDTEALGKLAYSEYGNAVGFKNYQGNPMPAWEDLTPAIHSAWIRAAIVIKVLILGAAI